MKNILGLSDNYQSTNFRLLTSISELLFDYLSDNIPNSKDSKLIKIYDYFEGIL